MTIRLPPKRKNKMKKELIFPLFSASSDFEITSKTTIVRIYPSESRENTFSIYSDLLIQMREKHFFFFVTIDKFE